MRPAAARAFWMATCSRRNHPDCRLHRLAPGVQPRPSGETRPMRVVPHPLIYDWNHDQAPPDARRPVAMLNDETLRDGLQSPSVRTPTVEQRIAILHHMDALGIDTADIGLARRRTAQSPRTSSVWRGRSSTAACASGPTAPRAPWSPTSQPIVEISQRTGIAIECCAFIGSSSIRQYAEGWTLDYLQRCTEEALTFAVREGLPVMYVTEDTTRAHPDVAARLLFSTAVRAGVVAAVHRRHRRPRDAERREGDRHATSKRCFTNWAPTRSGSTGTVTAIADSAWRRASPRSKPAPPGCTARRSASASAAGNTPIDLAARQPGDDGLHRSRSVDAAGVLRSGGARVRRADRQQLSGRRRRRVPHRDRRARGGGRRRRIARAIAR